MRLWWALCGASWREHPGRTGLALLAIALGVALALGVHLLNGAALLEFGRAARSLAGQPDLVLRAATGALRDADLAALLADPAVAVASPVLEGQARLVELPDKPALILIGIDPLAMLADATPLAPDLLPAPRQGGWQALLDPGLLHPNPAARRLLSGDTARLRLAQPGGQPAREATLRLGGDIGAAGPPTAVIDIAAAQALLGRLGELDTIDVRLIEGTDASAWRARLPTHWLAQVPVDPATRLADLTRAYRVNLGLLSLMALFTGGFLVYAVLSLSAAQRLPQWALAGVLGLSAGQRLGLTLAEGALLGLIGSGFGLLLGAGLAALALRLLGSNLGLQVAGGSGSLALLGQQPLLVPLLAHLGLGVATAVVAALGPALAVRRIAPAQVLKGLGTAGAPAWPGWLAPALALLGVALAFAPAARPGVPVAAYLAMLCLLLAGLAAVPALLGGLTAALQRLPLTPLRQLALARQRDQAGEARRSIAGVLIALALSVAMVVMIGSFRESLLHWLDQVLPADLYLRSSLRLQPGDPAPLPVDLIATVSGTPGVGRVQAQRSTRAWMAGHAEALELQARELHEPDLPLTSALAPPPDAAALPVYLNEAARDQLGLAPGQVSELRLSRGGPAQRVFVRAVWRDYARQRGAIWMSRADYQASGGDALVTELALKLAPGASLDTTLAALRALPDVEVISSGELRRISVQIFDQSFAITVWLQGVALAVGLFGVAAGASAQALARQREFGLLRHLGFSQAELRRLLWLEAGLLAAVGAAAGLVLGLALSAVLVFVVNPQSFHWTMEMHLPLKSLSALVLLALLASTGAAALAGRRAIGADAVRAVKEDW